MDFEDLFFSFLIEARTRDELERWISKLEDKLFVAGNQVLEANNFWEE